MTDDITNDLALLDDWLAGKGYGEEAGLVMRAMDLIRKQADEIEKLRIPKIFVIVEQTKIIRQVIRGFVLGETNGLLKYLLMGSGFT